MHTITAPPNSYRFLLHDENDETFFSYDYTHTKLDIIATDELITWSIEHNILYDISYESRSFGEYVDYDVKMNFTSEAELIIFTLSWQL